jgi:hypothetical protein
MHGARSNGCQGVLLLRLLHTLLQSDRACAYLSCGVACDVVYHRTHEKELKAVAVRFEADAMHAGAMHAGGLQEPHVQAAIRVSSRQSIEASALTY